MARANLGKYLQRFYDLDSEIAFVQRSGYRTLRWTYREVADAAARFARDLEARGINRTERVMVWGENGAEWAVAFFGCLLRGAVVVPMDRIASAEFAATVARQVDVKLIVRSRELPGIGLPVPNLLLEDLPSEVAGHTGWPYPIDHLGLDDLLQIVFTSGTTADPKGVVITHRNLLANLEPLESEISKYLKYERWFHPLRFLNLLPLSHVFGQFLGLFVPQALGATVLFQATLNPSEILQTVRRERVSVLIGVPRLLQALQDKIERDMEAAGRIEDFRRRYGLAANEHFIKRWWRFRDIHNQFGWKFWAFISGGATLDSKIEEFWGRLSFVVIQGYGLTETTSLVSVNHPFKLGKGSIGKALPGREIRLGANGEILVRGDNVASGYWQDKQLKRADSQDGWFRTGDVGALDAEGNLYFKGRKKSVLVTAEGLNIYPEDLEKALRRHPAVRDCIVVGISREGNEEPCAVLLLREERADPVEVIRGANEKLASHQQIRHWHVWPEEDFPRTSTQKPRSNVIAAAARASLSGQSPGEGSESMLALLLQRITGRTPQGLTPDSRLERDLNLSSLDRVELLSALEDRYQIDLNESKFSAATTVGELEDMLRRPVPKRSDYRYPRWSQRAGVRLLRTAVYYAISWPVTMILSRPRVSGRENLDSVAGPVLFVSNHITQVDIGFILAALPGRYRHWLAVAMLGEMLRDMRNPPAELGFFKRIIEQLSYGLLVALFNVFPLPQRTGFRESFAFAGESADRGYSILVFPEGRRTTDGKLAPFQAGIGMLADKLNLPVVPVHISGLYEVKLSNRKFVAPGTIGITIGAAATYRPGEDPLVIASDLESRMKALETSARPQ